MSKQEGSTTMEAIAIRKGDADDEMEVTIRGKSEAVIDALIHGLPKEGLQQLHDAIGAELAKRRG